LPPVRVRMQALLMMLGQWSVKNTNMMLYIEWQSSQ
jgi:hypothetical protein